MQLASDVVGVQAGPFEQEVDARWLMAYSAALGETDARYFDTAGELLTHPLFPVCYEWPAILGLRERAGLQRLNPRLVHAQHDLTIHRPARAGEKLTVCGQVVGAMQRRPGAFLLFRLAARDAGGATVTTTDSGMLYRGVRLEGGDRGAEAIADPEPFTKPLPLVGEVALAATAAHVYTECTRIWNPIHTDIAYARAAGLPGIILHGTATLAFSVSLVLGKLAIDPARVRRVRCRFSGMALMPSTLSVHASRDGSALSFETRNAKGEALVERGRIDLAQ